MSGYDYGSAAANGNCEIWDDVCSTNIYVAPLIKKTSKLEWLMATVF